jgi:hypothetical protein
MVHAPSPFSSNIHPNSCCPAAPAETAPGTGGADHPVSDIGNPFLLGSVLDKVDGALGDAISVIEREAAGTDDPILNKFRTWRDEVDGMRHPGRPGLHTPSGSAERAPTQEGGLFTD